MALNFPASPAPGEIFTSEGATFIWNGTVWMAQAPAVIPWATPEEARAGLRGDVVMSPALVQARSGMQEIEATGLLNLGFDQVPLEANHLDLIFTSVGFVANGFVRFAFTGATIVVQSSRVLMGSVYSAPTLEDNAENFLLETATNAQAAIGLVQMARSERGGRWGVSGSFRRAATTMSMVTGTINVTGGVDGTPRVFSGSAFTQGRVSCRWSV